MASKGRTKKKFPEIKESNEGKFTACSAATAVMKDTDKYKESVVKMANYANNFGCKR
mgnify:CR=1 FL=1